MEFLIFFHFMLLHNRIQNGGGSLLRIDSVVWKLETTNRRHVDNAVDTINHWSSDNLEDHGDRSEPLWWEKIGKVANQVKLAIQSHSGELWWKKIGKVANWAKLPVLSHSEQL